MVFSEGIARIFWSTRYDIPFFQPDQVLHAFYPELREIDEGPIRRQDGVVNVLLLGASVLHPEWGNVEQQLTEQLINSLKTPVHIYNVSQIGHTSRDSYLKYQLLQDEHFDLVIFYHGINEARANNAPTENFKIDYSHYSWYEIVNRLEKYHGKSYFALPYTVEFFWVLLKERLGIVQYVSMDSPRRDWIRYGQDIKSTTSFNVNLTRLLETAYERDETVLLMTFATHLPKDYSDTAFKEKALDYALHLSPVKIWGTQKNVIAAVAAHNEIIRTVVPHFDHVRFFDQDKQIPKQGSYFNDICHLTGEGSARFVENIIDIAVEAICKGTNESFPSCSQQHFAMDVQ